MAATLSCYSCGQSLEALSLPVARLDACPRCARDLHVCRMCQLYRPQLPTGCAEDGIEEVREKERANFCDYFSPSASAYSPEQTSDEHKQRAELDALFGTEPVTGSDAGDATEGSAERDAPARPEDLFRR